MKQGVWHMRISAAAGRVGVALFVLAVAFTVSSCSLLPFMRGKPVIKVSFTATADLNSCGKAGSAPLHLRVFQVTNASALTSEGTVCSKVWKKEAEALGSTFIEPAEQQVLMVGQPLEIRLERDPKARAVVVVGNFCKPQGSCWFIVKPLKGGGGAKLFVTAGAACLSETKR
jgi:type VI secretion system VasD/TssJ family lipoprotein